MQQQASPFAHLLKPKAGGIAFVLDAMGRALHSILDVTIVYPGGRPTMVDLFANRVREVRVNIRERPIPAELLGGDYQNDPAFRERRAELAERPRGSRRIKLITQQRAA